ncbi:MAG TPA: hypothetical protein VIH99_05880 [Bdellovibrionota bacterium]|jgi:hypothetical protein
MKTFAYVAVLTFASLTNAFALDRCEYDFRRGLSEMNSHFKRMSPACQRQVNLGEANEQRIRATCTNEELQDALAMKNIAYSRLQPPCKNSSCNSLRSRGVCVKGKPFKYYLSKFGM